MRAFRICGRSPDGSPGGADSLLDFLFSRCQRVVRDVQRALLYFAFDYAVQRCDRVGYFLLVSGISQSLDFNSSGHGFAQTRIGWVSFLLHVLKMFVRNVMISCIRRHTPWLNWRRFIGAVKNCSGVCVKRRTSLKALAEAKVFTTSHESDSELSPY